MVDLSIFFYLPIQMAIYHNHNKSYLEGNPNGLLSALNRVLEYSLHVSLKYDKICFNWFKKTILPLLIP